MVEAGKRGTDWQEIWRCVQKQSSSSRWGIRGRGRKQHGRAALACSVPCAAGWKFCSSRRHARWPAQKGVCRIAWPALASLLESNSVLDEVRRSQGNNTGKNQVGREVLHRGIASSRSDDADVTTTTRTSVKMEYDKCWGPPKKEARASCRMADSQMADFPVFDCPNKIGRHGGTGEIQWRGHPCRTGEIAPLAPSGGGSEESSRIPTTDRRAMCSSHRPGSSQCLRS